MGMTSGRIEKLRKLLEADPSDTFCLYALAQEFAKQGEQETALAYFDRVIALEPGHGYAYFHKARSLESMGRHPEARRVLQQALGAVVPTADPKAHRELQEYLQSLGG